MNVGSSHVQTTRNALQKESEMQAGPTDAAPKRSDSTLFFIFSAIVHIAAAVALSGSWSIATLGSTAKAEAVEPAPQKPAVARLAIDIAPVKYCEMKIEELVGRPRPQTVR